MFKINTFLITFLLPVCLLTGLTGCKKYLEIPVPDNELSREETFGNDANADAAVLGMYSTMYATNTFQFKMRLIAGHSADEMISLQGSTYTQFRNNALSTANNDVLSTWKNCYSVIYQANAILEGLQAHQGVSANLKKQLTGEAKFIRAVCHFYLTSFFGAVPVITTTDITRSALAPRNPISQVYDQIVNDLVDAQGLLADNYTYSNGERTRANKWAATAMLARVLLYRGDWKGAEEQATAVIGETGQYSLLQDYTAIFLANSEEAIWQFNTVGNDITDGFSYEGYIFIYGNDIPTYVLSDNLINAFEPGDLRKDIWTQSSDYNGKTYYYAQKYKLSEHPDNGNYEYQMVLRLAEQYLIRAEARAHQGNIAGSQEDLDSIRLRAGLTATTASDESSLLLAVEQERRIELFFEYGHRWFDLQRTGRADAVLGPVKPNWKPEAILFPVPQKAIRANPNLLPNNKGYN